MHSIVRKLTLALWLGLASLGLWAQTARSAAPQAKVILRVTGQVTRADAEGQVAFDEAALDALPQHSFTTTAPWFKEKSTFTGPYLSDLLEAVGAKGTTLTFRALNDYKVQVPVSDATQFRPILARKINNKTISVRDKGPLFLIYPFDSDPNLNTEVYFARSIWQIKSIHVD